MDELVETAFADLLRQVDLLLPRTADGAPDTEREHADVVAELLGFLARRMTELHERRQDEVASFLAWLEEQLGCRVDDLSGKTYVREYYAQPEDVDKLLQVIERNYPAVTDLDVSEPGEYRGLNAARQRVVDGYDRSMATLAPILRQLDLTDTLIDRIVYRLYGLSEADIELVEQNVGG